MLQIIKKIALIAIQIFVGFFTLSLISYQYLLPKKGIPLLIIVILVIYLISHVASIIGIIANKKWGYILSIVIILLSIIYVVGLIVIFGVLISTL